jgi:hypothetical protein
MFFKLSDTWGFKFWSSKSKAKKCFKFQSMAAQYSLAPVVGSPLVKFHNNYGEVKHGFITQCISRTLTETDDYYFATDCFKVPEFTALVKGLADKLFRPSIATTPDMHDICGHNVGWLGKSLVCIDFGCIKDQ